VSAVEQKLSRLRSSLLVGMGHPGKLDP
jgi:hypothetical protein